MDRVFNNDNQETAAKQYQPAEKVAIIREHLIEKKPVSDICDQYGIHSSVYYRWQQQFFEGGEKAFTPANEEQVIRQLILLRRAIWRISQRVNWRSFSKIKQCTIASP